MISRKILIVSHQDSGGDIARLLTMDAASSYIVKEVSVGVLPEVIPDLIILSFRDPRFNPSEILQFFSSQDRFLGIPWILAAPWPYSFEVQIASSLAPVQALLRFPLDPDELRLVVGQIFRIEHLKSSPEPISQGSMQFLRRFCHDANNFLEVIISSSSFLDDESYPEEVRKLAASITRASMNLARYIRRGVLIQGPLSDGVLEVKLNRLIHDLVDEIQDDHPQVRFHVDETESIICMANRTDLRVVLEEMLRNATETAMEGSERDVLVNVRRNPTGLFTVVVENAGSLPDPAVLEASQGTTRDRRHHRGIGRTMLDAVTRRNSFYLEYEARCGRVYATLELPACAVAQQKINDSVTWR